MDPHDHMDALMRHAMGEIELPDDWFELMDALSDAKQASAEELARLNEEI